MIVCINKFCSTLLNLLDIAVLEIENVSPYDCLAQQINLEDFINDELSDAEKCALHLIAIPECGTTFFFFPGQCICIKKNMHCEMEKRTSMNRYRLRKSTLLQKCYNIFFIKI